MPSFDGVPRSNTSSCDELRASLGKDARRLATARAERLANDLGVELGPIVRAENSKPFDQKGCGLPKFDRPPFGVSVQQTFALGSWAVVVEAANATAPAPQPTLPFPMNAYELTPPLVPSTIESLKTARALGYASRAPDFVKLAILLTAPAPPIETSRMQTQHIDMLPKTEAAVASIVPTAEIEERDFDGMMGFDGRVVVAHVTITVDAPSPNIVARIDRAVSASHPDDLDVYVQRQQHLRSCEAIEDAARHDAVGRAREAIRENGDAGFRFLSHSPTTDRSFRSKIIASRFSTRRQLSTRRTKRSTTKQFR